MEHAYLAPSSAERIELCNGSAQAEARYPDDEDTQEKREGVAVHWAGQCILEGGQTDVGEVAGNGVTINAEMLEAAELYAAAIMIRGHTGQIEETIRRPVLHPENWGTPDHWFFSRSLNTLWVDDLKYGHRFVDVYMNPQLIDYAALILGELDLLRSHDTKVIFTIVQPRSFHRNGPIRTWSTTVGELVGPWDRLAKAFDNAMRPDVKVTPHPDACRDCKARHECEGAIAAAYIGVDMAYQSEPLVMPPAALSREYRMLLRAETFIKARREGIKDRIMQTIKRNRSVPYFGIEHTAGRTVFKDDAVANGLVDTAAAFGVDVVKGFDLITPKQAIKAGVPEDIVMLFSRTNSGSAELVEDDGTRAAQVFSNGSPE